MEEERRREQSGLGVPIRPDLIPIGCPNLSRLRGSIGKSGRGEGKRRTRRKRDRRREPRGAPRRRRVPIDRDEGEENSRRNERASERTKLSLSLCVWVGVCVCVCVSFVSFRFVPYRTVPRRETRQKKMSPFSRPRRSFSSPWKSERERNKEKGRTVYHALLYAARVPPEGVKPTVHNTV